MNIQIVGNSNNTNLVMDKINKINKIILGAITDENNLNGEETALGYISNTVVVLIDKELVNIPINSKITSLAFRLLQTFNPHDFFVDDYIISMGTTTKTALNMSETFSENEEADFIEVRNGPYSIKSTEVPSGKIVNNFCPKLIFDRPFIYKGGNLLIKYTHSVINSTSMVADANPMPENTVITMYGEGYNASIANPSWTDYKDMPVMQLEFI